MTSYNRPWLVVAWWNWQVSYNLLTRWKKVVRLTTCNNSVPFLLCKTCVTVRNCSVVERMLAEYHCARHGSRNNLGIPILQLYYTYKASSATDVMQVVNFTDVMQVCHRVTSSLLTSSSCIISVKIRLDPTWYLQTCCKLLKQYASSLWIKSLDNQLVLSQLTTCRRLAIIKPEQAMRTHPDISLLMTAHKHAVWSPLMRSNMNFTK